MLPFFAPIFVVVIAAAADAFPILQQRKPTANAWRPFALMMKQQQQQEQRTKPPAALVRALCS